MRRKYRTLGGLDTAHICALHHCPFPGYTQSYEKACEKLKEVSALGGISGLLGWDEVSKCCCLQVAGGGGQIACKHPRSTSQSRALSVTSLLLVAPLPGVPGAQMVMMPSGAAGARGAQKAALAGVLYDKVGAMSILYTRGTTMSLTMCTRRPPP